MILSLRKACSGDAKILSEIENLCFPPDEAASFETIVFRLSNAPDFFHVAYLESAPEVIIGFVNGTCTCSTDVVHESMHEHHAEGRTLVVHSVSIHPNYRRLKLGSQMLKTYVDIIVGLKINNIFAINKILLLCKSNLLGFYVNCGFELVQLSNVVHGKEQWFEMTLNAIAKRQIVQYQVDAFTTTLFKGNPAAVILTHFSENLMQQIANENNLAETAFIKKMDSNSYEHCYHLRWFTPVCEIALCGHATLASASVLYENNIVPKHKEICFSTKSGNLFVKCEDALLVMTFPLVHLRSEYTPSVDEISIIESTLSVCSSDILFIGRSDFSVYVELTRSSFIALEIPQMEKIMLLDASGLVVTCNNAEDLSQDYNANVSSRNSPWVKRKDVHFASRFFAPKIGIPEDPVTGSVHCVLAHYWRDKLRCNGRLCGYQASERGGFVYVKAGRESVELSGQCVQVMKTVFLSEI